MPELSLQEKNNLTHREQEILDLMLEGVRPKDITIKLNISYKTFDTHRISLYRKFNVHSIQELFSKYNNSKKTKNFNSLASAEKPYIVIPFYNEPWGWHFNVTFPLFIEDKITAGDVYTFSFIFTSNVDFDTLLITLQDHTIGENGYTFLSRHYKPLSNIKANTEYSSHVILIPEKTATSIDPKANRFTLDVEPIAVSQHNSLFAGSIQRKTNRYRIFG